jgi:CRP/FNR family transcriptional regulator
MANAALHPPAPRSLPGSVCSALGEADLCLPCGLARLEEPGLQVKRRRLPRRATLYRQGQAFDAVYAVRAGTFKSVQHTHDGLEQVTGFHVPGEVLGLDGLARERHESAAVALEDSEVLVLPYAQLRGIASAIDGLHDLIARLLSREMVRDRGRLQLLAHRSAEVRLCAFLLDLSQRMRSRGFSGTEFHLRLTREEIGSYLGLNLETVSRTFGSLQQQRLLAVEGRHVRLLDLALLAQAAGPQAA